MFVVTFRCSGSLEHINALMQEHRRWLASLYERAFFVISGRSVPRTGGVMIARGIPVDEIHAALATDPFGEARLLHDVFEFVPTQWHPDLAWFGSER
jgi:uncharacterized protein YciI